MAYERSYKKLQELAQAKAEPQFDQQIMDTANKISGYGQYNSQIKPYATELGTSIYNKYNNGFNYEYEPLQKQKGQQILNYGPFNWQYQKPYEQVGKNLYNYGPYAFSREQDLQDTYDKQRDRGAYSYANQAQKDAQMQALTNWNYDPENDVSYQAYKQIYTDAGNRAMNDTLGQVAARTGGLASSYATSAAQQSYNNYMQQLAAMVPQLEQQAYNRTSNLYNMYAQDDATQYGRYRDDIQADYDYINSLLALNNKEYGEYSDDYSRLVNLWNTMNAARSQAYGEYNDDYNRLVSQYGLLDDARNQAYNEYLQDLSNGMNLYNGMLTTDQYQYGQWQDALNNLYNENNMWRGMESDYLTRWLAQNEMDWKQYEAMNALDEYDLAAAEAAAAAAGGGGGGGGGYGGGGYSDVPASTVADISAYNARAASEAAVQAAAEIQAALLEAYDKQKKPRTSIVSTGQSQAPSSVIRLSRTKQ